MSLAAVDRIPLAAGARPLVGHGLELFRNPVGLLSALAKQGPLCRIRVGPQHIVVATDIAAAWQVYRDDRTFDKGGPFYDRAREIAGNGLGTCPYSAHRRQRRLCQPAFKADRVGAYSHLMTGPIEEMAAGWTDGQTIDVGAELSAMTFAIITRTMFSTSLSENVTRQLSADLQALGSGLFRRMILPPTLTRLPVPPNRRYAEAAQRMRRTAGEVIADRLHSGEDRGDLMSALLQASASDQQDGWLSDDELIDQIFTFFLAGADTTAGTMAWALRLLDQHPDVRHRVHKEVDQVLDGKTPVTQQVLADLPELHRVIAETLRLYPPAWLVTRLVTTDTDLAGYRLPPGTAVALSPYTIHRDPHHYPNPDEFVPDRWRDTEPGSGTYLPFGAGARNCIGERFGLLEVAMTLATVTRRWRLAATSRPGAVTLAQIHAPKGLRMRATRRANHSTT